MKLFCFSTTRRGQGTASDEKSLGYVLLNLNSPNMYQAETDTSPVWHKLRGVPHTMELNIRATINSLPSSTSSSGAGRRNAFDDVVVSEDAEYIPIGTSGGQDVFSLDVTLAGVDLLKGISTTVLGPYYLTYRMFGVVTETNPFDSLTSPIFHPIVDSFRVQSNCANLSHFFGHEVLPLEIRLCGANNKTVAIAKVDCKPLAGAVGAAEFHGAELEGTYPFHPLDQTVAVISGRPVLFAAVAIRPVKDIVEGTVYEKNEDQVPRDATTDTDNRTDTGSNGETATPGKPTATADELHQNDQKNDYEDDFEEDFEDDFDEDNGDASLEKLAKKEVIEQAPQQQPQQPQQQQKEEGGEGGGGGGGLQQQHSPASSTLPTTTTTLSTSTTSSKRTTKQNKLSSSSAMEHPDSDDTDNIDYDQLRRYRLSVDLRSIREVTSPSTVYLSYTLPTFGAVSTVRTRPPISLAKNSESLLPHGYQHYEVCLTRGQLQNALQETSLSIEVIRKDKYQTDSPLGTATVPLNGMMKAKRFYRDPKTRKTFSSFAMLRSFQKSGAGGGSSDSSSSSSSSSKSTSASFLSNSSTASKAKYVTVRTEDRYIQVLQSNDGGRISKVASLRVVIILEDLGIAKGALAEASNVAVQAATRIGERGNTNVSSSMHNIDTIRGASGTTNNSRIRDASSLGYATSGSQQQQLPSSPGGRSSNRTTNQYSRNNTGGGSPYDPADDPQNQEALADWVASEYEKWEHGMKRKEEERMNELELIWSEREEERTNAINSVQKSYASLEAQLRHKLDSVENRERALHLKELELNRRTEVQAGELRIQQRRLEEELQHKIGIERRKVDELTTRVKQLTRGRDAAEDRARKVEKDFSQYRHDQRSTPEAVLHARVSEMTSKVSELQLNIEMWKQKYEVERTSKVECQAQLGRLVRELQAMRREQRSVQERNMEQLRLQYIAREERYILDGDRMELRNIKNELDDLKRASIQQVEQQQQQQQDLSRATSPSRTGGSNQTDAVKRLVKERNDLISTGAYSTSHPIIQSIDQKLKELNFE
jgi:hypothetical protein